MIWKFQTLTQGHSKNKHQMTLPSISNSQYLEVTELSHEGFSMKLLTGDFQNMKLMLLLKFREL